MCACVRVCGVCGVCVCVCVCGVVCVCVVCVVCVCVCVLCVCVYNIVCVHDCVTSVCVYVLQHSVCTRTYSTDRTKSGWMGATRTVAVTTLTPASTPAQRGGGQVLFSITLLLLASPRNISWLCVWRIV